VIEEMNSTLFKAVGVVTLALIFYSIGVITQQRKSLISRRVLWFLTAGIICDLASTGLMIAGSRNIPITVHGFIGYSALIAMLIDTLIIWRLWVRERIPGNQEKLVIDVPRPVHLYTRAAYSWWVVAYIAGAVISMTLGR
jgi:hypothetical protein